MGLVIVGGRLMIQVGPRLIALAIGARQVGPRAVSILKGARLARHLGQLAKYGKAGVKTLESGAIRYYGEVRKVAKVGEMMGMRVVRQWNPATNTTRTWMETLDHAGRVRIVRPETGGAKVHYLFDAAGNFVKTF